MAGLWSHCDPVKDLPDGIPLKGCFPPGHFPSNSWEVMAHRSSGTLWIDVTVPCPHARGAQQGIPVPIPLHTPSAGGEREGDSAAAAGARASAAVPEVAVPVPISRSDNQLPSAAVAPPGTAAEAAGCRLPWERLSFPARRGSGAHTRGFPGLPHLSGVSGGLNVHVPWISG